MKKSKSLLVNVYNKEGTILKQSLPPIDEVNSMSASHMWYLIEARYRQYLIGLVIPPADTCLKIMFIEPEQENIEYYYLMQGPLPIYRPEGSCMLRVVMRAEGTKITKIYGS